MANGTEAVVMPRENASPGRRMSRAVRQGKGDLEVVAAAAGERERDGADMIIAFSCQSR